MLCAECWTPDDVQRNCSKHAEFFSKNKFEKLMHLIGFILRIYQDARSSECHIPQDYSLGWLWHGTTPNIVLSLRMSSSTGLLPICPHGTHTDIFKSQKLPDLKNIDTFLKVRHKSNVSVHKLKYICIHKGVVDAPGNDGNASMPEQVKRPNPWRKMMMMMMMMMI